MKISTKNGKLPGLVLFSVAVSIGAAIFAFINLLEKKFPEPIISDPEKTIKKNLSYKVTQFGGSFIKMYDYETGVICYVYSGNVGKAGIDCIEVENFSQKFIR